jgi:phage recombination protein Bet
MTTAVANQNTALSETSSSTLTPTQVELIKNSIAKGASNDELQIFLHLANRYNLDPFAKEIWCIKLSANDPAIIMASRDGYLKIANNSPSFNGIRSGVVKANDHFRPANLQGEVEHVLAKGDRGDILGAYAIVFRKDWVYPVYQWVEFSEYKGSSPPWRKYPSAMIQKVAESMALKRAYSISGLVTQEEMDVQEAPPVYATAVPVESASQQATVLQATVINPAPTPAPQAAPAPPPQPETPAEPITGRQKAVIKSLLNNPAFTEERKAKALELLDGLTKEQADKTIGAMEAAIKKAQADKRNGEPEAVEAEELPAAA